MNYPQKEKRDKPLIVMCNGPSLKEIDVKSLLKTEDVFGMNAAYRFFEKEELYPKYFGCFDTKVTNSHRENYIKFIENSPIEKAFLLYPICFSPKLTVLTLHGNIGDFSTNFENFGYGGNTGANSCQVGICLGYTKIILIGADCNYKEVVDGAENKNGSLVIKETPEKNPNYFFDDYQRSGDVYNYPQSSVFHKPAWERLSSFAKKNNIDIVNCSHNSKLECFRKSKIEKEI